MGFRFLLWATLCRCGKREDLEANLGDVGWILEAIVGFYLGTIQQRMAGEATGLFQDGECESLQPSVKTLDTKRIVEIRT